MKRNVKKLLVLIIIFLNVVSFTGCDSIFSDVHPDNHVIYNASVYYKFNVPFLTVSGTSFEMGYQYGVLLKDRLSRVYSNLRYLEKTVLRNLPIWIRVFSGIIMEFVVLKAKRDLPEEYIEEIKGISYGSGIPERDILFASFIPELYNFSCTSFVKVTNGNILHGRNLDYYFPLIGENPIVIRYKPSGKIPYTAIGCVGYPGVFTGMNEKGITVSVDAAPLAESSDSRTAPITFEIRYILSNASSIEDVDKILKNYHSIKGWMLIVGSAREHTGVVYNIAGSHIKKSLMANGYIAVTNTFLDNSFAHKYMRLHDAGSASSMSRLFEINKFVSDIHSPIDAISVLSNTDFNHYKNAIGAGDVTLNNEGTLQSVVMDPKNDTIYFSSAPMYAGFNRYFAYNIKNDKVGVFRKPNPIANSALYKNFQSWFKNAEMYYLENNFKKAKSTMKNIDRPYLSQLMGEYWVDEKLGILKEDNELLKKADFVIKEYPDYALPYLIKSKILFSRNNYVGTSIFANKALLSKILFSYQKAEAYELLANAYRKMGKTMKAKQYAKLCMSLMGSYAANDKDEKVLSEMKSILKSH